MKLIFKYILSLGIMGFAGLTSCKKLTQVNVNPNQTSTTHPQALLTKIQWDAFRVWRGADPLYALKMIVQTDRENANQIYNWQRHDFKEYELLRNVAKMDEEADKIGEESYKALAKFFRAYYFYNLTLIFGDIPYRQAAKGESAAIFTPKYDRQKEVFAGILEELEQANAILKKDNGIIGGDIIYAGNVEKWRKLINSFRLKVLITLSNKTDDFSLDIKKEFAKIYAEESLISDINGSEDGQLIFLDQEGNRYPEFNSNDYGSGMYMDATFIERLQNLKDPRLFVIATQTKLAKEAGKALDDFSAYEGGDPIVPYAEVNAKAVMGRLSKVHERYHQDPTTEPLTLLGYAELQFILAEATLKGWITGNLSQTYENGIKSSFIFYGKYAKNLAGYVNETQAAVYIAQNAVKLENAPTTAEKLERIMMQKYLRSFEQGGYGAYFDYLRTGYPSLKKGTNVKTAYRWMYPQSEYDNNKANVSEAIQAQFNGNDNINLQTWWLK